LSVYVRNGQPRWVNASQRAATEAELGPGLRLVRRNSQHTQNR